MHSVDTFVVWQVEELERQIQEMFDADEAFFEEDEEIEDEDIEEEKIEDGDGDAEEASCSTVNNIHR